MHFFFLLQALGFNNCFTKLVFVQAPAMWSTFKSQLELFYSLFLHTSFQCLSSLSTVKWLSDQFLFHSEINISFKILVSVFLCSQIPGLFFCLHFLPRAKAVYPIYSLCQKAPDYSYMQTHDTHLLPNLSVGSQPAWCCHLIPILQASSFPA